MPYTAPASPGPVGGPNCSLLVVVYAAYSCGRLLARGDVTTAVDHGLAILRAEKALFLNAEHPLNRLFTETPALGIPADFVYASLHYLVTPAVLVWLFRRRPLRYRAARTWLMLSTLLGLVGFTLMPTCPPRLLDAGHGFVDTMAQYSSYGWWGGEASAPRGMGGMTNQYAAMPSLHVGWALWCGVMLWRHGRTPLMKTLAGRLPPDHHDRGDGHRQPLLPRRGRRRGRDGHRRAADPARPGARRPGAAPASSPAASGLDSPRLSVPDARLPRVSESLDSGPRPQAPTTALRQRLAELRGPAVPPHPLDARALAALAANPGCNRRALLDGAGVDKAALATALGSPGDVRAVAVRLHAGQRLRGEGEGRRRHGTAAALHGRRGRAARRPGRPGSVGGRPRGPRGAHGPRAARGDRRRRLDAARPPDAGPGGGGLARLSGAGRGGRPPRRPAGRSSRSSPSR